MARGRAWRTRRRRERSPSVRTGKLITPEDDNACIDLLKWTKRNGIRGAKIAPADFKLTGRGLMALEPIAPKSCLVSVPLNLLITENVVESSAVIKELSYVKIVGLPVKDKFCLFLISEMRQGSQSKWNHYIASLPETFHTPYYLKEKYYQYIPEELVLEIKLRKSCLQESYERIHMLFSDPLGAKGFQTRGVSHRPITYNEVRWAWNVINTRSVYYNGNKSHSHKYSTGHSDFALAPFLDFMNHSLSAKIKAEFCQSSQCFEIHTFDSYRKGEEIFISYGDHDNQLLFFEYGFCLSGNPHDSVTFDPMKFNDILRNSTSSETFLSASKLCKKMGVNAHKLSMDNHRLSWELETMLATIAVLSSGNNIKPGMVPTEDILDENQKFIFNIVLTKILYQKQVEINDQIGLINIALNDVDISNDQIIILSNILVLINEKLAIIKSMYQLIPECQ